VVEPVLTANNLASLLPFVRNSRGLALMSALSVRTPVDLNALVSLPIRARASLARGIQVQAMRDRRLPRAVRGFLRQLTDALPPPVGDR
jgi:DNA-binding transcriptional LysR family regulator